MSRTRHLSVRDGHEKIGRTVMRVRDTARLVIDEKDQIRYFEGSLEDITERLRTEEAVRESENRNHTLVETLQEGIERHIPGTILILE